MKSDEKEKAAEATEEKKPEQESKPESPASAPADALSRTPEDLGQEQAAQKQEGAADAEDAKKQPSGIKKFIKRMNLYFVGFLLLLVIAGAIAVVTYLNSQKAAPEAVIPSQKITPDALEDLASSGTAVGNASQTLSIKGNAIIDGQMLLRSDLGVAGAVRSSGEIQGASLTISGSSNLGEAQINGLQIANDTAVDGNTTLSGNLNVGGTSSFSGAMTASRISVSQLIMSGNATLQIPNHIKFTGPTPSRSINPGVLGSGGSASISGSDTSGTVNISTGGGTQAGCFAQITFAEPFDSNPRVIVSPVNSAAGKTQYYTTRSTTGFSLCTAAPAPPNQSFAFDYFVAG